MKKLLMLFLIVALTTVGIACNNNQQQSNEEKITIKHQLGETQVTKTPKKVVVFDFGVLDSLDQLGIEVAGLPKSSQLPSYLEKYKDNKYHNTGTLKEPDFEKLSELNPDLIIISGRQQELYKEFQAVGPTIFLGVDTKNYVPSFKENMTTIGKIFGKEQEIDKEVGSIQASIKKLNEKATNSQKNALVILANDDKVSAYGSKSRFGLIHDEFGLTPVDKQIKASTHGQSITFEYIVEKDPDYLYVVDRGAVVGGKSSAKQMVENELVKKTKAYNNRKIIYLDANLWYNSGGGLRSVNDMVKEIDKSLQ